VELTGDAGVDFPEVRLYDASAAVYGGVLDDLDMLGVFGQGDEVLGVFGDQLKVRRLTRSSLRSGSGVCAGPELCSGRPRSSGSPR
jgi:hypothetical protein